MSTDKHTPTPWIFEVRPAVPGLAESYAVMADTPKPDSINKRTLIAAWSFGIPDQIDRANAAFIVRACNSHEALVKALEPFAAWVTRPTVPLMAAIRPEEWDRVSAALKLAKGA